MDILVFGAGVIGTLYAAKLRERGHRVTVLARGERLIEIRQNGLTIEDIIGGGRSTLRVEAIDRLRPDDHYDMAVIAVRRDQLTSVMPELAANRLIPMLLLMLNNPGGCAALAPTLGEDRVLCGFPGAGGTSDGHIVRYAIVKQQPTTIGELEGRLTARVLGLARVLRDAGFPTTISRDMDAWLKAHAFFVTAICGAIYLAGGDTYRLSEDKEVLPLMVRGVREGFTALRSLGLTVKPFALQVLFTWLPSAFAVHYWRRFFATKVADCVFGGHASAATQEMRELASDCRALLAKSGIKAPALERLYGVIETFSDQPAGRSPRARPPHAT